jgi:hypothetical protein
MLKVIVIIAIFVLLCYSASAQNSPVCITKQPHPISPADPPHAQGMIILRVQMLANGKIGTVKVVKDLVKLANVAIDAVWEIEFEPKLVNGIAVDAHRQVAFSYWYGAWSVRLPDECGSR